MNVAMQGLRELGQLSPVWWVPDSVARECSCCGSEFGGALSLVKRRHHCRSCGVVVCNGRSKRRVLIRHINETAAVRICDTCDCNNVGGSCKDIEMAIAVETSEA